MKTIQILATLILLIPCQLIAQDVLKIGDKAPVFNAVDENKNPWDAKDHIGKEFLVFYFYPAAMTGGCTKQACSYRDFQDGFSKLGAKVVGISGDQPENLVYFKKAHNLNFTLLSDMDGTIAKAFGVPTKEGGSIQRDIDGASIELTRGVTAMRWTFIVDKKGQVVYIDNQVNATEDSQNTLAKIKNLILQN